MAKKITLKNPMVILVLVLVVIFVLGKGDLFKTTFKGAAGDVSSAIITRTVPLEVKINNPFNINYVASGMGTGSWGVLIEDVVTNGGCTPTNIDIGWVSPSTTYNMPMTAPASAGSCILAGTYVFAGDTDKSIQVDNTNTITVCADECSVGGKGCIDINTEWNCDTSGVCGVKISTPCDANWECTVDECIPICADLKTTALNAITTWSGNPTTTNKNAALGAIVSWATEC